MARPKKKIDEDALEKLVHIGCTTEELAFFFGVSRDTLERRYAALIAKGRATAKIRLRKIQFDIAKKGSAIMAIFLGKQMLGQTDKVETSYDQNKQATITLKYKLDE